MTVPGPGPWRWRGGGWVAGNVTLGVAAATTAATVAEFPISITAGSRSIAVAAGALGGSTNAFRLMVIDSTVSPWSKVEVANAK